MLRQISLSAAVAVAVAAVAWSFVGDGTPPAPQDVSLATRWKVDHLDEVVRVLAARSVDGLTDAQRAERQRVLDALVEYRDGRRFPKNVDEPGRGVPYFIDGEGTRCAMAYVFEQTGAPRLTSRLALEDNHAYLNAYSDDPEFVAWLDAHGMQLEEVCYVQGPGYGDDTPTNVTAPAESPGADMPKPVAPNDGVRPGTSKPSIGRPGPVTTGKSGGLMGKKRGASADLTVAEWWKRNRSAFIDVRERYQRGFAATPSGAVSDHLPSADRLASDVIPFLEQLTSESGEVGSTALVALARATAHQASSPAVPAALRMIGTSTRRFPEFVALALGVSRDPAARMPLRLVLSEDEAGAQMVGETDSVPSRVAAFAALALGQVGDAQDARRLVGLAADKSRPADVRSLALLGVARLVEVGDPRDGVVPQLARLLSDESLLESVRALVPQALVKSRDPQAIALVSKFLAEFRKPLAVRRAAALALGEVEAVDGDLARRLLAASERDPDAMTRAYAALSLGRIGVDAPPSDPATPTRDEFALYHRDGIRGQLTQHGDRPWRMIAAALHARRTPEALHGIELELLDVLTHEAEAELRGAAALALGIANARDCGANLLERLDAEGNPQAKAFTAEALGMLADTRAAAPLAQLLAHADSELVRYHAAIGLALLADGGTIDVLMTAFESTPSDSVRSMLTRAIGELGDATAIDRLERMALDANATERSRARAVAALGMIAEGGSGQSESWVRSVQRGVDGSLADPIVKEVLSIF